MIRRPLLFVAAGFSAAIFISYHFGVLAGIAAGVMIPAVTVPLWAGDRRLMILGISFLVGSGAFAVSTFAGDPLWDAVGSGGDKGAAWRLGQDADGAGRSGPEKTAVCVRGTVRKVSEKQNDRGERSLQMTLAVHTVSVDGRSVDIRWTQPCRTIVNAYGKEASAAAADLIPGRTVEVCGRASLPETRRNPGCFDYRLYLRSLGIRVVLTADSMKICDEARPGLYSRLEEALYLYRKGFAGELERCSGPETAAMMEAVLFGDKSGLDEETMDVFTKNGTAHILAVSGLHIGILYAFLLKAFSLIPLLPAGSTREWILFVFTGLFFFCYMILASFSPSVVRAVLMVLLHAFAKITGRRYDLNSAAFAVFTAVLMHNPYMLFNVGFEMSFLAVLSMCLVLPYVRRVYDGLLLASLSVQLGLGPFILYHFHCLSLLTVLINVPVIFLAGIIVPLGLCHSVVWLCSVEAGAALARCLALLCDVLVKLNDMTAVDGVTTFIIASPGPALLMLYYFCLLFFASEEGRLRLIRACRKGSLRAVIAKASLTVILLAAAFGHIVDDGVSKADIVFVDVGQGDCMHLRDDGGVLGRERNYLIDGGGSERYFVGEKVLEPYLLMNGVAHVDGAFVTHLHTDHYRGVCELAKAGMVDRLYVYEGNRLKEKQICEETGLLPEQITYLRKGQRVTIGKAGFLQRLKGEPADTVEVLWPEKKTDAVYRQMIAREEDENASSLILRVTVNGTRLLATGDLGEEGERQLLAYGDSGRGAGADGPLHADILKVGHHGSRFGSSEEFLDAVSPSIAVIQVGENNMYGHPTAEVLQRLAARGIPIYRNDLQGAVGIKLRGGAIRQVKTMLRSP